MRCSQPPSLVQLGSIIAVLTVLTTGSMSGAPRGPWLSVTPAPVNDLNGVTFGKSFFVAVGAYATILTSTNGANWTLRTAATNQINLYAVTCGSNLFVAVGATREALPQPVVWTSPDGVAWTPRDATSLNLPDGNSLQGVTYGKGLYVAVGGNYGTNTIAVSTNGIVWTLRDSGPSHAQPPFRGVAYGKGGFAAVGGVGGGLSISEDGLDWGATAATTSYWLHAVTFAVDRFVAVGPYNLVYSFDGTNWPFGGPINGDYLHGVTYGDGYFVNVGLFSSAYSTNGINWTVQGSGARGNAVAYGNSIFVAVDTGGTIYRTAETFRLGVQRGPPIQLTITGLVPGTYRIESKDSLNSATDWSTLVTLSLTNSPFVWTDLDSTNVSVRFYRAVWIWSAENPNADDL